MAVAWAQALKHRFLDIQDLKLFKACMYITSTS